MPPSSSSTTTCSTIFTRSRGTKKAAIPHTAYDPLWAECIYPSDDFVRPIFPAPPSSNRSRSGENLQQVETVRTRGPRARRALTFLCTDESPDRSVNPPLGISSRAWVESWSICWTRWGTALTQNLKAIGTAGRLGRRTHRTPPVKTAQLGTETPERDLMGTKKVVTNGEASEVEERTGR